MTDAGKEAPPEPQDRGPYPSCSYFHGELAAAFSAFDARKNKTFGCSNVRGAAGKFGKMR